MNLGFVYYRKDNNNSFSLGYWPERGEGYHPWGVTDAEWKRSVGASRDRMGQLRSLQCACRNPAAHGRLLLPERQRRRSTHAEAVLAYTHDDVFKPVPGFKVMAGHFHLDFNEQLRDRNTLDYQPPWVAVFRALGINILYLGDFHDDSHPNDPGPVRFKEEKVYFEGAQRVSDKDFLVMPAEEPNAYFGGHWWLMTPKPIYFSHAQPRPAGQAVHGERSRPTVRSITSVPLKTS